MFFTHSRAGNGGGQKQATAATQAEVVLGPKKVRQIWPVARILGKT
jgi:hypothetical protein